MFRKWLQKLFFKVVPLDPSKTYLFLVDSETAPEDLAQALQALGIRAVIVFEPKIVGVYEVKQDLTK